MKANYVHSLKTDELEKKLDELKKELFNLRLSHSSGNLSNPLAINRCKKDIARVKTVLRKRALETREEA